jgi:hypothetical protein
MDIAALKKEARAKDTSARHLISNGGNYEQKRCS